jgi:hypothetical protein
LLTLIQMEEATVVVTPVVPEVAVPEAEEIPEEEVTVVVTPVVPEEILGGGTPEVTV